MRSVLYGSNHASASTVKPPDYVVTDLKPSYESSMRYQGFADAARASGVSVKEGVDWEGHRATIAPLPFPVSKRPSSRHGNNQEPKCEEAIEANKAGQK